LKITFKWDNILNENEDYNTKKDEPIQTIKKPSKDRSKKVNTKSSKAKNSIN